MKGVILAAGYASRFLPASKTIPKEMFPLIDRPVIDFIVKEMVDSGIEDILLVSSRRKKVLEDYFDREVELSSAFVQANALKKLELIQPIEANIFTLRQKHMMGTGNALLLVEPFVQKEAFVVAYPDDIILGKTPLSQQMIQAHESTGNTILAVEELPEDQLFRYGVIDPKENADLAENLMQVQRMVEKPLQGNAPSNFVSYGRYLYTSELFEALKSSDNQHGHQGEFTQTEAINMLARQGKVSALKFEGKRYDVGEPLAYLLSSIELAMERSDLREGLITHMEHLLKGLKKTSE